MKAHGCLVYVKTFVSQSLFHITLIMQNALDYPHLVVIFATKCYLTLLLFHRKYMQIYKYQKGHILAHNSGKETINLLNYKNLISFVKTHDPLNINPITRY